MEQLIQRLIEVDKEARERVAKAKKERAGALDTIEAKRNEIEAQNDFAFEKLIAEEKARSEQLKSAAKGEIEAKKQTVLKHLDDLFEQNEEAWIEKLVASVLKG